MTWVIALLVFSWNRGLISLPTSLTEKSNKPLTVVKKLYYVESWDSEGGWLYLQRDGKKIMQGVDLGEGMTVIIPTKTIEGSDIVVVGRDYRWKTLFCTGDKVMVIYDIINGEYKLKEIRNNGERSCSNI